MVDSVGGAQTYGYDGLNRQTRLTPPGAAAVTATYDPAGNPATFTDPAGTVTYWCKTGMTTSGSAGPAKSTTSYG